MRNALVCGSSKKQKGNNNGGIIHLQTKRTCQIALYSLIRTSAVEFS